MVRVLSEPLQDYWGSACKWEVVYFVQKAANEGRLVTHKQAMALFLSNVEAQILECRAKQAEGTATEEQILWAKYSDNRLQQLEASPRRKAAFRRRLAAFVEDRLCVFLPSRTAGCSIFYT